jgi:hypothetical protein
MIEIWEALDCESVGRIELEQIQQTLLGRFGEGAMESPAAIARALADEGAVLRHPEIFECDSHWRAKKWAELSASTELDFSNLSAAMVSFGKLEEQRHLFEGHKDVSGLARLNRALKHAREECMVAARSKVLSTELREEAKEVAEWLAVWLRSPQLFPDWLDLRMRSTEFKKKFGT